MLGDTNNPDAKVTNICTPEELPNKTPIFISRVSDIRSYLVWLGVSCPSGLSVQLKGEKLMVVPATNDGFRATVSALRSLDGSKGVNFYTFSIPEVRCVRLLVKNLGKKIPESVVREDLEALSNRVQGIMQLRTGRRDQDLINNRPPTPHFTVCVARGPQVSRVRSLTQHCRLRVTVESYVAPKCPLQCKRCQGCGRTQSNCEYAPRCIACGGSHLSGECLTPRGHPQYCSCGVTIWRTTGAGGGGKKQRRLLQGRRPS